MKTALPEEKESLWTLAVSPSVWAAHFLACYAAAAVSCEKWGALGPGRKVILAATILALALIAANGWSGWRRSRRGAPDLSREFDTDEDRHRFLGYPVLLLSGLSLVATLYAGAAALYFEDCR